MSKNDKYSGFTWMTEEMKRHLLQRDKIVEKQDIDALFSLKENSDFSIALHQILIKRYEKIPNSLNPIQLNLFLCMQLENAAQADHILSFLQEWFSEYSEEVVKSLYDIDAIKSAELIKQAVRLLPEDGGWFFDNADEDSLTLMSKIDKEFSSYPDGPMRDLYRKYAENNKNEI